VRLGGDDVILDIVRLLLVTAWLVVAVQILWAYAKKDTMARRYGRVMIMALLILTLPLLTGEVSLIIPCAFIAMIFTIIFGRSEDEKEK
jgi:hypothetical protein